MTEEKQTEQEPKTKGKTNWKPTVISILIGIAVTVGATWYTVEINRQEAVQAESERLDKVKENLVSIIEEHIVNKDSIDLESFSRLVNNRTREEKLYTRPSVYNLITQAEYNIQNSKHLSFDKKLEYSKIISSLYEDFKTDTLNYKFSESRFPEEAIKIISLFNETNKSEGKKMLLSYSQKYEQEISSLQKAQLKKESFIDSLLRSPTNLVFLIIGYLILTTLLMYYLRARRKKLKHYEILKEKTYFEREKIKAEIVHLMDLMNKEKLPKEDRKDIEQRIDYLFEKLDSLEKYYSQHGV